MGSGASGFALYWNRLVWVNTCAPFRATDREGRYAPGLDYTSSTVVPHTAPRKPTRRLSGEVIRVPFALFTGADHPKAPAGREQARLRLHSARGGQGPRDKRGHFPPLEKPLWWDELTGGQAPQGAGVRECSP